MSENTIEQSPEDAGSPGDPATVVPQQDSHESNLNAEAKSWRLKYQGAQATAAQAVADAAEVAEKLKVAERQLVDQHIAARIVSTEDFHSRVDAADLLDESGALDLAKVDAALADVLAARPHWAPLAPGVPLAAPAPTSGGGAIGGMRPTSVLDPAIAAEPEKGWADVLGDAAKR